MIFRIAVAALVALTLELSGLQGAAIPLVYSGMPAAEASETGLSVQDYEPYFWQGRGGNYTYGYADIDILRRKDAAGNVTTGYNFMAQTAPSGVNQYRIHTLFPTSQQINGHDVVLACVRDIGSDKYYIFKSVDDGMSFGNNAPLFNNNKWIGMLGDVDGTVASQIPTVRVLTDRSFCEATVNGVTTFLIGEYNVNPGRVSGGPSDGVRLLSNSLAGSDFSEVAHWNTDGKHYVRHIHCVRQDPYGKRIYVGFGDGVGSEASMIAWDGSTPLVSNSYASMTVKGLERYRTCDFVFTQDAVFTIADTKIATEQGIWKFSKDLSQAVKVDTQIAGFTGHSGMLGYLTKGGALIFSEILEFGVATDLQMNIYLSTDGGNTFLLAGKYGMRAGVYGMIKGLFEDQGRLYLASDTGAGKGLYGTVSCSATQFTGDPAEVVHPVYFVAPGGTDDASINRGWTAMTPWASADYALGSSRVTGGARVVLAPGSYASSGLYPAYGSNPRPGTGPVILEGAGSSATVVQIRPDAVENFGLLLDATQGSLFRLRKLKLYSGKNFASGTGINLITLQTGGALEVVECALGDAAVEVNSLVLNQGGMFSGIRSLLSQPGGAGHPLLADSAANAGTTLQYCLLSGGSVALGSSVASSPLVVYNSVFSGYSDAGVWLSGKVNLPPTIRNCIFYSSSGAPGILDYIGLPLTDAGIDYNSYLPGVATLSNSGGSHSLNNSDPQFINDHLDLRLRSTSPCISRGIPLGLSMDFTGAPVGEVPSIGAYQYQPAAAGTAPPVTVATPGTGVYRPPLTVTLVSGAAATYYTSDGSDPIHSPAARLYGGPITLTANATLSYYSVDASGNVEAAKQAVYALDSNPPISKVSPAAGLYNSPQLVTLSCSDSLGSGCAAIYYTSDGSIPTTSSATYAAPIAVSRSATVKFFAVDQVGNVEPVQSKAYVIDTTAPQLRVSSLTDGALTSNALLNISGSVSDQNGIRSLTVNGTVVAVQASGAFSTALQLVPGNNTVITVATDNAGNDTSDLRNITLDLTAPVLTLTSPADNSIVASTIATLSGTVDKTSVVLFSANNGVAQPVQMAGNVFSASVNLVSGLNTIVVTATDLAGITSNQGRTVILDDKVPSIAVDEPVQDTKVNQNSILLQGRVSNALTAVTVLIQTGAGRWTPAVVNGAFEQILTLPVPGLNKITVTVTDQAGNQAVTVRNVLYAVPHSGDLNGDGVVDLADAVQALQMAVGIIQTTADDILVGDVAPLVNGKSQPDGRIDVVDVLLILRKVVGLASW